MSERSTRPGKWRGWRQDANAKVKDIPPEPFLAAGEPLGLEVDPSNPPPLVIRSTPTRVRGRSC